MRISLNYSEDGGCSLPWKVGFYLPTYKLQGVTPQKAVILTYFVWQSKLDLPSKELVQKEWISSSEIWGSHSVGNGHYRALRSTRLHGLPSLGMHFSQAERVLDSISVYPSVISVDRNFLQLTNPVTYPKASSFQNWLSVEREQKSQFMKQKGKMRIVLITVPLKTGYRGSNSHFANISLVGTAVSPKESTFVKQVSFTALLHR
jgi:hypothetical protein